MPERGRYMISVAADLAGLHPQTLRMYEARGLVRPARTPGGTRLYSENDIELRRMRNRMEQLERELREEIRSTHRQYRREVVVYHQPQPPATRS